MSIALANLYIKPYTNETNTEDVCIIYYLVNRTAENFLLEPNSYSLELVDSFWSRIWKVLH